MLNKLFSKKEKIQDVKYDWSSTIHEPYNYEKQIKLVEDKIESKIESLRSNPSFEYRVKKIIEDVDLIIDEFSLTEEEGGRTTFLHITCTSKKYQFNKNEGSDYEIRVLEHEVFILKKFSEMESKILPLAQESDITINYFNSNFILSSEMKIFLFYTKNKK